MSSGKWWPFCPDLNVLSKNIYWAVYDAKLITLMAPSGLKNLPQFVLVIRLWESVSHFGHFGD